MRHCPGWGHVDNMAASGTLDRAPSQSLTVHSEILRRWVEVMRNNQNGKPSPRLTRLEKALTGIAGFDEVTDGGLPKGRPTIVCGGPGCGKTMFALEFLVRGATQFNEPGVLLTFEETSEEMTKNA